MHDCCDASIVPSVGGASKNDAAVVDGVVSSMLRIFIRKTSDKHDSVNNYIYDLSLFCLRIDVW